VIVLKGVTVLSGAGGASTWQAEQPRVPSCLSAEPVWVKGRGVGRSRDGFYRVVLCFVAPGSCARTPVSPAHHVAALALGAEKHEDEEEEERHADSFIGRRRAPPG
jgi:hypothetical protein